MKNWNQPDLAGRVGWDKYLAAFFKSPLPMLLVIFLAALAVMGCDSEPPSGPTALAPTPSPSPTPDPRCEQDNLKLRVLNGAGNEDVVFGYLELITAIAQPRNAADATIPPPGVTCPELAKVVGWSGRGPGIQQLGDLTGFTTYWRFQEPGDVQIIATHSRFKAIWSAVLVRSHGEPVPLPTARSFERLADGWYEIHGSGRARALTRVRDAATLEMLR